MKSFINNPNPFRNASNRRLVDGDHGGIWKELGSDIVHIYYHTLLYNAWNPPEQYPIDLS